MFMICARSFRDPCPPQEKHLYPLALTEKLSGRRSTVWPGNGQCAQYSPLASGNLASGTPVRSSFDTTA